MKIQLERKLQPCRDKLRCTVCQQIFVVGQIRSLLYQDSGLLQGDVCSTCTKLSAKDFKESMVLHARILLQQGNLHDAQTMTLHEQALELLAIAKEPMKFPSFWQQLVMHLDVLAQDTQELEAARLGLYGNHSLPRSHPRLFLEDDRSQN
ncbi:hypothetical protein [Stenomitos frigidus]|uniref:Uncharacterized protein n=1 Tax=Stenomitos frigidus ULC18 TaxID=2107698 RepID=A0A2T1E1S6_9CYAN|nr:hypothetical protein [Stenomitos frigidus]PSB26574.1 hypothetical protein C7B82_19335 [Stenomitos frigidus ULC18]